MEIFANVGETQKTNYIQQQKELQQSKPIEENEKLQKDKQNDEIHKAKKEATKEELQRLTEQLNKEMAPLNPDIKFHFNDKVEELVVNVIDKKTDKIIRKIPSDEALRIMEKMRELVGALFDEKG
jgi:flagellar protein FlaG